MNKPPVNFKQEFEMFNPPMKKTFITDSKIKKKPSVEAASSQGFEKTDKLTKVLIRKE